jgi:glycosyltransferase involved in cell wall biosynthesis
MRIAQVIATFPPYHGGMGYVCFHNARELARRGHEITVFTLEHHRLSYERDPEDFRIVRLTTPLLYGDGGMVPGLYFLLKDFEIVHLHYPFFGGAEYVYLSSLLRGQPYFLTYHMDVYGSSFLKKMLIGIYEPLLMKKIIRKAALIGALSFEHLKSSKAASWVDWERVVEMPNGVDIDRFQPREKDPRLVERYGLENKIVVLFVGNFQPFKGLPILIDAISKIKDDRIVALVVGDGYGEKQYRGMVRDKALGDRIIFAGPQAPDRDLPLFYNLGDFLVLPSTHSESFGLVVLEAMASGKPAIVSALPGPSKLINEGIDGLIAKTGDVTDLKEKIEYLSADTVLSRKMGGAARDKVINTCSWEKVGEKLERTLLRLVDGRGKLIK